MNDAAFEVLKKLREEKRSLECVFLNKDGTPIDLNHVSERILAPAIRATKVRKICFHDLRSTYATNFLGNGGNIHDLSRILGHTSVDMTFKKYAAAIPEMLNKASQIVNFQAINPEIAHCELKTLQVVGN